MTEIDLLALISVLKKRWWMIVIAGVLGCFATAVLSLIFIKPRYKSSTQLYVLSKEATPSSLSELQVGSQLINDYKIMIHSRPVLEDVVKTLRLNIDYKQLSKKLKIENPKDTRIIVLTVTDQDPEKAMVIVNQIAASYSKFIEESMEMISPKVIESGIAAKNKSGPDIKKNGFLGGVLGILLMCIVLIGIDVLDESVKNEEDVEKYLGVTVLASIPDCTSTKKHMKVRKELEK